ncbi:hypothetical protein [Nocardioides sp. SR21]|uniref:hypothetical protein n=1 Tax=Nocardioides sp. SR21 TaxID=2919501 RepID=UPI001FAA05FF|nr:hypothetical protein [Nocardioides sp. SR21]
MTDDSWTNGGSAALATYAPDVLDSYGLLVSVRPSGVHDEMLESPAVVAFAEQFRVDVARIDESVRARFLDETGGHAAAIVNMVWIADVAPRIREALDALFGPSAEWPGRRRYPVADTAVAVGAFLDSVARYDEVHHDHSSDRPDAANAALALSDAMVRSPSAIPASVVEAIHELLTPEQAVDVVLDGARRSAEKIETALAA